MGLNRFVIHTSVHQPLADKIPGLAARPIWAMVQPKRDLGGTGRPMDDLPGA